MMSDNEKVSVEEMVEVIEYAERALLIRGEAVAPQRLVAARDYILAASKKIADRDAQIAELTAAKEALGSAYCEVDERNTSLTSKLATALDCLERAVRDCGTCCGRGSYSLHCLKCDLGGEDHDDCPAPRPCERCRFARDALAAIDAPAATCGDSSAGYCKSCGTRHTPTKDPAMCGLSELLAAKETK